MLSWLEGLKFTVPTNEIFEHSLRVWPGRSDVEAGDVAHGKLLNPQPSAPESSHAGIPRLKHGEMEVPSGNQTWPMWHWKIHCKWMFKNGSNGNIIYTCLIFNCYL